MKTTFMANAGNIERKWFVVDAEGQIGRLAAEVAKVLRENINLLLPRMSTGDFVIVVNAAKVKLTGKKLIQKTYFIIPSRLSVIKFTRPAICSKRGRNVLLKWQFAVCPRKLRTDVP